jgi:serine/threonine protein kinase
VLHRDISVGNILITLEGNGLLIDWDLCARLELDSDGSRTTRRPDRTVSLSNIYFCRGPFSDPFLRTHGSLCLQDSLERTENLTNSKTTENRASCHVLTWIAWRFLKHRISGGSDLTNFLDEAHERANGLRGGNLKMAFLVAHSIPNDVKFDDRPRLDELIIDLTNTFAVQYKPEPSDEETMQRVWIT